MPFYRCTIYQEDQTLVARDVEIMIEETEREGVMQWHGTISISHTVSLVAPERYRLETASGRKGEFQVRRNTFAGGETRAVAIHGIGPLR